MSVARQLAIANIQNQIAQADLLKTQNFYGAPGRVVQTPQINVNGQVVTPEEANAQIGALKTEDTQDTITENAAKQARLAQAKTSQAILGFATSAKQRGKQINRSLGNVPTPGDIWVPFWILIFIFLVLIPVGGHTRLNWLWLVMIGHAELTEEYDFQINPGSVLPGLGLTSTTPLLTTTTGAAIGSGIVSPPTVPSNPNQRVLNPPTNPFDVGSPIIPYLVSINSGE